VDGLMFEYNENIVKGMGPSPLRRLDLSNEALDHYFFLLIVIVKLDVRKGIDDILKAF
jgi:hypothetical protein